MLGLLAKEKRRKAGPGWGTDQATGLGVNWMSPKARLKGLDPVDGDSKKLRN